MSFRGMAVSAAIVLTVAGVSGARAQTRPTPEQVERFIEMRNPGPEHAVLARLAGEWDQEIRMYPEPGMGSEPVIARGTAMNRMIMGGRFLESTASQHISGMETDWKMMVAFDRRKNVYVAQQMDSWGTYWVTASGAPGAEPNTIVMSGTDDDPVLQHTQVYEFRLRIDNDDRYVLSIVFTDEMHTRNQGPFTALEIVSTRRKT